MRKPGTIALDKQASATYIAMTIVINERQLVNILHNGI